MKINPSQRKNNTTDAIIFYPLIKTTNNNRRKNNSKESMKMEIRRMILIRERQLSMNSKLFFFIAFLDSRRFYVGYVPEGCIESLFFEWLLAER